MLNRSFPHLHTANENLIFLSLISLRKHIPFRTAGTVIRKYRDQTVKKIRFRVFVKNLPAAAGPIRGNEKPGENPAFQEEFRTLRHA